MSSYSEQRAKELTLLTRDVLKELPDACAEFIQAIGPTTQPLTRYAYACDLRLFCGFLVSEIRTFAGRKLLSITYDDFGKVTPRDFRIYLDYLSYYVKDDAEHMNSDISKMRKLSSVRSFYEFLFKNGYIESDTSKLVDMPKRRGKPIIRLEIDEVARLLDAVENGDGMTERQKRYNEHTRLRDLTILTVFLSTGIRVSELVGLNISDIDFSINGFLVTRKGGSQAVLYFPDECAETLREYMAAREKEAAAPGDGDALFLSLQGKRISVRAVQIMVKKYASQAAPLKQHLSPHKLRSTFGTNLYHETGDIYLVAEVLGHSDVNTTRRHYAAMSDDRRRMAARHVVLREDKRDRQGAGVPDTESSPDGDSAE